MTHSSRSMLSGRRLRAKKLKPLLLMALVTQAGLALAQAPAAERAPQATPLPAAETAAQTVVVTGNPLRRSDPTQPVTVLSGEALALRRSSTLGERRWTAWRAPLVPASAPMPAGR